MNELLVVKIGGNVIDDDARLQSFLKDFYRLPGSKILVHGGGAIASQLGEQLGINAVYVGGRRVTDAATLRLVTMVYGGLVNKEIVAALQALGCHAIGFTGADGNLIRADKRPVVDTDYGHVGDIRPGGVQTSLLQLLIDNNFTPVLAPLTHDGQGGMLNTNADTIAQEVAVAMSVACSVRLIYCFEKPGVLRDANDEQSVISVIRASEFAILQSTGVVSGGMIPKLTNAFAAVAAGVQQVVIGQAEDLQQLATGNSGTIIF